MSKRYEKAPDAIVKLLHKVAKEHHEDLVPTSEAEGVQAVTFDVLLVFDDDNEDPLKHHGYPALAVIRCTSTKDRTKGVADVELLIDGKRYDDLKKPQRIALLDHELEHLVSTDKTDDAGRPKVRMRTHDWEVGGFNRIVDRHGAAAIEAIGLAAVVKRFDQLVFQFAEPAEAA